MFFYNKTMNLSSKMRFLFYKVIYKEKLKLSKGVYSRNGFRLQIAELARIEIGENTFFNHYCSINAQDSIKIGSECLFGENVKIYDHNHIYRDKEMPIRTQGFSKDPVVIGSNCWIGSNVVILKGVTIGDNCIIGANCLVYRNVPSETILKANFDYSISERKN